MILVERHHHRANPELSRLCRYSKELYNLCTYHLRTAYFGYKPLPGLSELVTIVAYEECYLKLHNTKTAKQTIRQALTDWTNYRKAKAAYKKNPDKFTSKPKPPSYKQRMAQVIFYAETIRKKQAKAGYLVPTNDCFRIKSSKPFKQVIVTPKRFGFIIDVRYETKKEKANVDKKKVCAVDIGLNTLAAVTSDQHSPLLVNGRIVKSFNQEFNKHKCKRTGRKRYNRIENYFHHASKWLIQHCIDHQIGTVVIGKNDGWKQELNLGAVTNQNFTYVPFYSFLQKVKYKAELVGIDVVFTEEAYTSKASCLDGDPLPKHGEPVPEFSGKRKYRGLYVSESGVALNADVNGSYNVGRKVFPEFVRIGDRGVAATPVVVNPLQAFRV